MNRVFLMSKLHNAKITEADVQQPGSFWIDREFMEAADILVNEQVHVYNINTGAEFSTYALPATYGSKTMRVNGTNAHLVSPGDRVIICTYGQFEKAEYNIFKAKILLLDEHNNFTMKDKEHVNAQSTENMVI